MKSRKAVRIIIRRRVCARCLCTMFVHPRVATPMHPSTTFLEETGPKPHYLAHIPLNRPNTRCFGPVSALFQPCPLSTNIRPKHAKRWCASGSGYRSEMLEQRIRGYSQNRPKTSVKQPFYREYSQYKVKYLLFWPYSSKNHSHSSKNRYRSFEHVSRRNGRIRVFGQNDPKRVNSSKKRPKTPVFGPYPAEQAKYMLF